MLGRSIALVAASILTAGGLYCAAPSRNVAGNPHFETLIDSCTLDPSKAVARLYQGNGGATTAFWYTATLDPAGWSPERQIYYSYRTGPKSLLCDSDGLHLVHDSQSDLLTAEALDVAYRGEIHPFDQDDPELIALTRRKIRRQWMGGAVAALGALLLYLAVRRPSRRRVV